jgi:methylthioribose-1-phosphate isomerase
MLQEAPENGRRKSSAKTVTSERGEEAAHENSDTPPRQVSFYEERTVRWNPKNDSVVMIDQTLLPGELRFITCRGVHEVVEAIKSMKIRGAPAIGVAAAMGVALSVVRSSASTKRQLLRGIESDCCEIKSARPTAINLSWGVDRVVEFIEVSLPENLSSVTGVGGYRAAVVSFVCKLADADIETNKRLSELGSMLFRSGESVLTHCN